MKGVKAGAVVQWIGVESMRQVPLRRGLVKGLSTREPARRSASQTVARITYADNPLNVVPQVLLNIGLQFSL